MSRLSKYVKEKLVKVLVAALVVGTVAGNDGITAQAADVLGTASLSNPYSFTVYANEYTKPNHVEGNVAVGTLKAHVDTWRYCSYVGDFADNNASMTMNVDDAALVYPAYNSDGSRNELTEQIGQGYKFSIYEKDSDTLRRYFITDNKLVAYDVQDNIKETIAAKIVEMQGVSAGYYGRADVDNDTELVLNLTAGDVGSHLKQIFLAADAGKKVLVNILDCGNVTLAHQDDNYTSVRHEHADWAANIIWNFGNASYVETGRVFGYILAPNATVHNGNNVIGGIICNVLEQVGEVHMPDPWTPRATPTPTVTPTPVVTEEPTPTPVVTEEPTPTPVVTEESTPTPDDPGTPDNPTDPGTPEDPVTPETPQVLGARRRRMVTIEDDPTPLADRAVLGASRRPQTGDASDAWNLGFALSLTGLGAWLILKKKQ